MNWNDIPLFLAIAESGTLAGAARKLGLNHSTIFRRLNALERTTGTRLFDRLPERYQLTPVGSALLEYAHSANACVDAFARLAAGADQELSGDVRLTTAPNLAVNYVPPALVKLKKRHPSVRVQIIVSDTDYDLSRREADLALRATSKPPDHLVGRRVVDLAWHLYASRAYLRRMGTPAAMSDLNEQDLIGADDSFGQLTVFRELHRRFDRDRFTATSNTLNTMAALARSGIGIALLPNDQIAPGLVRLFEFAPQQRSALWLLTHPDLRRVARIRAVSDALYDHIAADPKLIL